MQHAAACARPRQIVGKGRPQVGAELEDLGLAERRMQRIGRVQQLDRRAHADAAARLALDHRRADHEHARRRAARCRAGCADAAAAPAATATTSRERTPPSRRARRAGRAARRARRGRGNRRRDRRRRRPVSSTPKRIGTPRLRRGLGQRRQRAARIEMRLVGKEQRAAEAAGEIGLERGDALAHRRHS